MKNIYLISEENHGTIGAAKSYQGIIHFLITEGWLEDDYVINWMTNTTINTLLGDNWNEEILKKDIEWFKETFDGCFYIRLIKCYE